MPLGIYTLTLGKIGKEVTFMDQVTVLLLPYRKKMNQLQYLLQKALIPAWDQRKDICGICIQVELENVEVEILNTLKSSFGYIVDPININSLGVCAGDRTTSSTYYLYAVDLSKSKSSDDSLHEESDLHFWATDLTLLESIDAQLIACYAKIQYILM